MHGDHIVVMMDLDLIVELLPGVLEGIHQAFCVLLLKVRVSG